MFRITIEETRRVKRLVGKEWKVIDTVEVVRDENVYKSSDSGPRTRIKEVMGYTPEVERDETETRQVLVQCVDELDLADVIRAINKL